MNDIEKKLRKRAMQKLDKYAHNPYHVNKPSFFSRIPLWGKIMVPASLVAAVAVVAFVGLINGFGMGGRASQAASKNDGASHYAPAEHDTSNDKGYTGESSTPVEIGEKSVPSGALSIVFQEKEYKCLSGYSGGDAVVADGGVGSILGETVINEGKSNEQTVSVYEIKNYSSNAFIAIKFANDLSYYSYYNTNATYDTINDLITQIPFMSDSYVAKGIIYDTNYMYQIEVGAEATINSMIFEDTSATRLASAFEPGSGQKFLQWNYYMYTTGGNCFKVMLYDSGYLAIYGYGMADGVVNVYQIGAEKYSSLRSHVHEFTLLK